MTEILTESFCERCGTRYTFESARPKTRLKGVKVLSRGLKNFVLSDDTSIDEAMAAARSETDREASVHQLDAFHKTFNFCMSCRQYTCPNCWNEAEVRCLSCAPLALPEAPAEIDDLRAFRDAVVIGEPAPGNGMAEHVHEARPTLPGIAAEADSVDGAGAAESPVEADLPVESIPQTQPDVARMAAPVAETEPIAATEAQEVTPVARDAAGKAAAQTTGLLRRFRPGQNLDDELDAFERERGDITGELAADEIPTIEPHAAPAAHPEPIAAELGATEAPGISDAATVPADAESDTVAPAPIEAAAPAAELEAVTPPEPEIVAPPEPQPLAAASADVVDQPTWRITAPDPTGATQPTPPERDGPVPLQARATPSALPTGEPQWPARSQWPSSKPAAGLPFLGRPATPQGGIEALWAASSEELATAAPAPQGRTASGIQPCVSCGLSLSATARFCRRCGTLQGR